VIGSELSEVDLWRAELGHNSPMIRVDIDPETGTLDMADMQEKIGPRTKLVAVGYASNATGSINDVATIVSWAKAVNALTFVDAVQYAPHGLIDVRALDCDFLAFSGHKMLGPMGIGVLVAREERLEEASPFLLGGGEQAPRGISHLRQVVLLALTGQRESGEQERQRGGPDPAGSGGSFLGCGFQMHLYQ